MSQNHGPLSSTERIKQSSDNLRGTLAESLLNDVTGNIYEDDVALVRFHGMYIQDDRDRRDERAQKKLERLYSFMIRLRLPGGYLSAEQWRQMHHVAGDHSTGTIKITTRQTVQLHGVLKSHVKPTLKGFNQASLTTIATCGDINRNVLCTSNPIQSKVHAQVFEYAKAIDELLLPKTNAYYEIWLDQEKLEEKQSEEDPLYQDRYMPRKFKIAIAIPPNNDVDVLTNDIGLIAVIENDELLGFNIAIGGGMSATHGNAENYARLASVIGFADTKEKVLKTVYEILTIQRDYGNRSDRKLARLKYTVDRMGLDWWKQELINRTGFEMEAPRPFTFDSRGDYYGWQKDHEDKWHYTVFIENGRILDTEQLALKTALYEVALTDKSDFIFTCNQNLIISNVKAKNKAAVNKILQQFSIIDHTKNASLVRRNAMACVAFNTCPLALAEAQRYMPTLLTKIEPILEKHALQNERILIRMTGCPNGCSRPFAAEIGFVGTAYGKYNMLVGGDLVGLRLNKMYKESLDEAQILNELDNMLGIYKIERKNGESFGDFAHTKWLNGQPLQRTASTFADPILPVNKN